MGGGVAVVVAAATLRRRPVTSCSGVSEDFEDKLTNNKVVVVSKAWCPYCMRTKKALTKLGVEFELVELEDPSRKPLVDDVAAYQDYMGEKTGARSVPRVFVGGEFVGGCDDTLKKIKTGEFEEVCKKVGAL